MLVEEEGGPLHVTPDGASRLVPVVRPGLTRLDLAAGRRINGELIWDRDGDRAPSCLCNQNCHSTAVFEGCCCLPLERSVPPGDHEASAHARVEAFRVGS